MWLEGQLSGPPQTSPLLTVPLVLALLEADCQLVHHQHLPPQASHPVCGIGIAVNSIGRML